MAPNTVTLINTSPVARSKSMVLKSLGGLPNGEVLIREIPKKAGGTSAQWAPGAPPTIYIFDYWHGTVYLAFQC